MFFCRKRHGFWLSLTHEILALVFNTFVLLIAIIGLVLYWLPAIDDYKWLIEREVSSYVGNQVKIDKIRVNHGDGAPTWSLEGVHLIEANGEVNHIPVVDKSEVFDVSGAGDTAVAAFILALTSGATSVEATKIANFAAGIAVRKLGTATVSNKELEDVLGEYYVDSQK